jgi:glycosyltransferase involved in cell wall biosynthesis/SAM-dependent methyltransferase
MQKLDISLAVPGLPFNGETFPKQSLGGSETAGYYMGRELAKLGHRVTVFCNGDPVNCEDVNYLPLAMWRDYVAYTPHDVAIVQRAPALLSAKVNSRFTALWCHDLALLRSEPEIKGTAWNADKIFVLSEFMKKQYAEVYGLPEALLYQTRNGIDLETIRKGREEAKKVRPSGPRKLLYAARPERGLDVLLEEIMPRLLKQRDDVVLYVCAYDNPVDHLKPFYDRCKQLQAALGNHVVDCGALNKPALYKLMHVCDAYVYPTPSKIAPTFDEVSCIAAMEAQACGLPFITTKRGALPETIEPGAGILVGHPVHTEAYYDAFVSAVNTTLDNDKFRSDMALFGQSFAKNSLSWAGVAQDWTALFESEIRKRSANKATLVNHFWRRSDIYAAEQVVKSVPIDELMKDPWNGMAERLKDFDFIHEEDGFRKQYEKIGITHDPLVYGWVRQEKRYQALKAWLLAKPHIKRVLDYGCAHGAYALNLAEETGVVFTGLDIDVHSVEMAQKLQAEHCTTDAGKACEFYTLDAFNFSAWPPGASGVTSHRQFDAAIAFEVLEHVAEPWTVLEQLEPYVKDGGHIVITVPFGPWEYSSYHTYPHRCHVWEFDLHDLHDIFDGKEDVGINSMPSGPSPEVGEALGWWFCEMKVKPGSRGPFGRIDMERKTWLQRPRQTVSAAIIAGPGCEDTLHWCLKPLQHVADEVVIVDCGMSQAALDILSRYPSWWVKRIENGPDPKTQGFETPRNLGLEHCVMDWILWIDTDEKLLSPECLTKYLRANVFNGYSLKQHHFAVDTTFEADLPVRLFRNGISMRFFGMIHEHPELELNHGPGLTIVVADASIAHVGYLHENGRRARFSRNYPMLQADIKKYPDRKLQKQFIMRDNMLLNMYELSMNGQQMSNAIIARCEENKLLYREHFLGKDFFSSTDPSLYYSQALELLGEGFEVAYQINAAKSNAQVNGTTRMRFATQEEMLTELNKRAKAATAALVSPYY